MTDFAQLQKDDMDNAFLSDYAIEVVYKSSSGETPIKVQVFEDSLDKLETTYTHVLAKYDDIPTVEYGDVIIIDGVEWGVVDYTIDPMKIDITLFIQEVE